MYLFRVDTYEKYFNKLPHPVKIKAAKMIEKLKNSYLISTVMLSPLKNWDDTYKCRIDDDYFFALLLDGQFWVLLFVGNNEKDIAG